MTEQCIEQAGPAPILAALTTAQRHRRFLLEACPDLPIHTAPVLFRLRGPVDLPRLRAALRSLFATQPALRTVVTAAGQHTVDGWAPPLPVVDAAGDPDAIIAELIVREQGRRFDVPGEPTVRTMLARFSPADHVLLISADRTLLDDRARAALLHELVAHYSGESTTDSAPTEHPIEPDTEYWLEKLAGVPNALALPADRPHRTNKEFRCATYEFELPDGLRELTGGTPFTAALAGLVAVLARYGRTDDFLIGTVAAPGTAAIGRHETLVPVRADTHGEPTVRDLLDRTAATLADALRHPDFPFDELATSRDPGRLPLIQAVCTPVPPAPEPISVAGLEFELLAGGEDSSHFDLAASVIDTGTAMRVRLSYQMAVFDRATVARLAGHWRTALAAMVADPGRSVADLPMLSEAESRQLLFAFNATAVELTGNHDPQRAVARHAATIPDDVAVECAGRTMTYRELDARVDALAAYLLDRGVRPDSRVAILLEPSIEYVVCVLAVLRSGGASVPMDTDSPAHRLGMMLADSGAELVLTQRSLADRVPAPVCLDELSLTAPDSPISGPTLPQSLAYIIFTSGSTGRPQGVGVTRANLANYLAWVRTALVPDPAELVPVVSRLTFDGALKQLFPPLLAGRRVWLLPRDVLRDPAELTRQLAARDRVAVGCTPSLLEAVLDLGDPSVADALARSWARVLLGGEPLSRALVDRMHERYPHTQIWNVYGPTETTANSSVARVDGIDRPYATAPIGGPVWNCTYYVLDDRMAPVPIGVAGELYIGGTPVAREYVGRADVTADRFVPDPFGGGSGARLYRTGDLVRWLPDGMVEFLGRKDFQVKIRGMRIEPGEVEAALREHPAVAEAVVMARSDGPVAGQQYLAAYVRPTGDGIAEDAIRAFLRERVATYLMPTTVTVLAEFPRLHNGKTDRRGLPAPDRTPRERVAPRTDGERAVVAVFEEILGVDGIGIEDDFFALGGHSLLAARVAARINEEFGVRLGVRAVFTAPTVAGLYGLVVRARVSEVDESVLERALAALGRR
jgi:amino acid adenylation domain-containing protein